MMSVKKLSLESFPTLPELILTVLDAHGEEMSAAEIAAKCEGLWVQSLLWPINCHPDTKPTIAGLRTVDEASVSQELTRILVGAVNPRFELRGIDWARNISYCTDKPLRVLSHCDDPKPACQRLSDWVETLRQLYSYRPST